MTIAVVGAFGVVGRAVIRRLLRERRDVRAVDLSCPEGMADGGGTLKCVNADIMDRDQLTAALSGCEVVINVATAIPKPSLSMDWSKNDAVRRKGTRNLITALGVLGITRLIQQSVSMLYCSKGRDWIDEDSPSCPSEILQSAADMEKMISEGNLSPVILRGGLLYGPETGREDGWLAKSRDGSLQLPGDGGDYVSLIHREDLASAFCAACTSSASGIFNVVDDEPVQWRELFEYIARQNGAHHPNDGGSPGFPSQRVSNRRAKALLNWRPQFPSYREGLKEIR